MKRSITSLLASIIVLGLSGSAFSQEIIKSFPAPGDEVRGVAWDGEYLWCTEVGNQEVLQLDTLYGMPVHTFSFGMADYAGGINWAEDNTLWLVSGASFNKLDPNTGDILHSFSCPGG